MLYYHEYFLPCAVEGVQILNFDKDTHIAVCIVYVAAMKILLFFLSLLYVMIAMFRLNQVYLTYLKHTDNVQGYATY